MCYEPGYAHLSKSEQREERARVHAHHIELRANLDAGLPGAREAYDRHLDEHRRSRNLYAFTFGDQRARSILAQRKAEARVASRKADRREALTPDPARRAAARLARIQRRALRRVPFFAFSPETKAPETRELSLVA